MQEITYRLITPTDDKNIGLIAQWYLNEWNIPVQTTIAKTKALLPANNEFQLLMMVNGKPVATGGVYTHVGLLDKEPRFNSYKNWLALVYTLPKNRGNGLGKLLCEEIQNHSKKLGLTEIYLFTHTAESLYKRLGWKKIERISLAQKDIAVMKKTLL